jgi:queuine tRNA-ribosyltransferase
VFSLEGRQISEKGVAFQFEENGEKLFLGPEQSMAIQRDLGSDIVMAFDECVDYKAPQEYVQQAVERTTRWAERSRDFPLQDHQFMFGIVQGGIYQSLRRQSAREITALPFDGFAVGGVSVGEGLDLLKEVVGYTTPLLPSMKPRYLMGVGLPEDIFAGVERGIDMFDCVIPTRYARQGTLFTRMGKLRIMDKAFRKDKYPLDTSCRCYTCQTYSRMVLRYLFFTRDPLAETLATIHNLTFYQNMMQDIRQAIEKGNYDNFQRDWLNRYFKRGKPRR